MKIGKLIRIAGIIILSLVFSHLMGCDSISGMFGQGEAEADEVAQEAAPETAKTVPEGSSGDSRQDEKTNQKDKQTGDKGKEEKPRKWEYVPENKNDPFEVPPAPEIPAGSTVGQQFDLEQLLLIGIVQGAGYDAAYIRLPNGEGRVVRVNDPLGKMGGVVTEIGKDYIIVEETYIKPREDTTFVIKKRMPMVEVEE
ncbi:MAG: hypothetical protein R6V10_00175 [bacterium]